MVQVDTEIRRARDFRDYQACVDLQREIWGFTQLADAVGRVISMPVLKVANRLGGCVLVAQERSGQIVGFSFASLAKKAGVEIWWSQMTAVAPEHRNKDIGLRLKEVQREEALRSDVKEIHWTFDPLQSVNGYFNIYKLGAIVREYEANAYGVTSSALHHGLPTDRFVAEWHLASARVRERLDATSPAVVMRDLDRIPQVNPGGKSPRLDYQDENLLVEIPANLRDVDPAALERWQDFLRLIFAHYFHGGYAVTDFIKLDEDRPQAFYLLSRTSAL